MKISLFQGVILGVFALAALIGVFVFATFSGSSSSTGVGTVVIWGTLPQQDMQNALTAAVKQNEQLKAVTYVYKDPATFEQDLISAIAAGDPPDLALISQEDILPLAQVIQPIPATTLSVRSFESAFTDGSTIYLENNNAGTYGLPYLIDPLVLFNNSAMLASSGIPQPPSTWDALIGLVDKVASITPSGQVERGLIALGTYNNVDNARAILSALLMQAGVPLSTMNQAGTLSANLGENNSSSGQPPGEAVVDFYTQFADPTKVSYTWNDSEPDSQSAFVADNLALYIGYASEAAYIEAANPNISFDVSPLPQPADATEKLTYGKIYAFAIPHGAKNVTGAYSAALALLDPTLDATAAADTGLAPALKRALSILPSDPVADVAYQSALYARGWLSPAPATVDQIFSAMIESVTSGRSPTGEALTTAQSALTAVLQQ